MRRFDVDSTFESHTYPSRTMSAELDTLPRCNCGAFFRTNEALRRHVNESEYSVQFLKESIRSLCSALERLQIHSQTQDNPHTLDEKPLRKHRDAGGLYNCPRWGCNYKAKKPCQLSKHYGQHLQLSNEPPCVYCNLASETAAQYLEHAGLHSNENCSSEARKQYVELRCKEILQFRNESLTQEVSKVEAPTSLAKKRKRNPTKKPDTSVTIVGNSISQGNLDAPSSGTGLDSFPQQASMISNEGRVSKPVSQFDASALTDLTKSATQFQQHVRCVGDLNASQSARQNLSHEDYHDLSQSTPGFQTSDYSRINGNEVSSQLNLQMHSWNLDSFSHLQSAAHSGQDVGYESGILEVNGNSTAFSCGTHALPQTESAHQATQNSTIEDNTARHTAATPSHAIPVSQGIGELASMEAQISQSTYEDFCPLINVLNFAYH